MSANILSIVGDPDAPRRTNAEIDRDHAVKSCRYHIEKASWFRRIAREPHLFNFADGSPVRREWARGMAQEHVNDARAWRNKIRAAL